MKITLFGLSFLFLLQAIMTQTNAQPEKDHKPTDTLVVMWTSGDADVAEKACLMYAHAAKRNKWFKEVILIIWGPSQRTLVENMDLQEKLNAMAADGVILEACIACSDRLGVTGDLIKLGIDVKGMGIPLTGYLKQGYRMVYY